MRHFPARHSFQWSLCVVILLHQLHSSVFAHNEASKILRIPLTKHVERRVTLTDPSITAEHVRRAHLAHQQQRIRRRAQEDMERELMMTDSSNVSTIEELMTGDSLLVYNEVPLGVGYGTHYAELYLGIPAQQASVIVDTGSHLTALPCTSCDGCGNHTDPLFDVSKSTTATLLTCEDFDSCKTCEDDLCVISQKYTEGSMWRAVVVDELVWAGGFNSVNTDADSMVTKYGVHYLVACQTEETGLFITQKENGIMGMGRSESTLLSYMLMDGLVDHDVFTLCFSPSGGSLVFGGVDTSHHTSDISYTALLPDHSGWYHVNVKDIQINGKSIDVSSSELNSGRGVIVDSGSTDTFFVASGSEKFYSAFEEATGIAYSEEKMEFSPDGLATMPTITIVLDGISDGNDVQLELSPEKYLTFAEDEGYYYGGIHFSERRRGVIGANAMINYDVIFDAENDRIGFAKSSCADVHEVKTDDKDTEVEITISSPDPTPIPTTTAPTHIVTSKNEVKNTTKSMIPLPSIVSPDVNASAGSNATTELFSETTGDMMTRLPEEPMILTVVGVLLAFAIIAIGATIYKIKKTKNETIDWRQVKAEDDDDDDDDEEEEEDEAERGLVNVKETKMTTTNNTPSKHRQVLTNEQSDSESDDDEREARPNVYARHEDEEDDEEDYI